MKITKKPNNCFCKEVCVKCKGIFTAGRDYIYETKEGCVCYDCMEDE